VTSGAHARSTAVPAQSVDEEGAGPAGRGSSGDVRRLRAATRREAAVVSRERAVDDREQAVCVREDDAGRREGEVLDREDEVLSREEAADRRDALAARRDGSAEERDQIAERRDHAAEVREGEVVELVADLETDLDPEDVEVLTDNQAGAAVDRSRAGEDRRQSAGDRSHAQADRAASAVDRELVVDQRESALFDDLTGVLRRGPGFHQMGRDLTRAQRSGEALVLAFVDVDGLNAVNDTQGHLAGDALLRSTAAALRDNLRPYDTVLRYGGDEFVCGLVGLDEAGARTRLSAVNADLGEIDSSASVTIGVAVLHEGDDLEALVQRADADLYRQRQADGSDEPPGGATS
jgi:diguanylate cyclase (GGDEF)-like protein